MFTTTSLDDSTGCRKSTPAQLSRPFTMGTGGVDQYTLERQRFLPKNHVCQIGDSNDLTSPRMSTFRQYTQPTLTLTSPPNGLMRSMNRRPVSLISEQDDDDPFVGPNDGFPRLPNVQNFGVLRILHPEEANGIRMQNNQIPVSSVPDEPRVEMVTNVAELRRLNFERTGIYDEPPPDRDLSTIPAFLPENNIRNDGRRRHYRNPRIFSIPEGKTKKKKTLNELNKRVTQERLSKTSDPKDSKEMRGRRLKKRTAMKYTPIPPEDQSNETSDSETDCVGVRWTQQKAV